MIDAGEMVASMRREQIRQAIATQCLRTGGETIISTKGGLQKWLIDWHCQRKIGLPLTGRAASRTG